MTSRWYAVVQKALAGESSNPIEVFHAACELSAAFVRNEHLIGLLPLDAPEVMVQGFELAGSAGLADSFLELAALYRTGGTWQSPLLARDIPHSLDLYRRAEALGSATASLRFAETVYFNRIADYADDAWRRANDYVKTHPDSADGLLLVAYMLQGGFGTVEDAAAATPWFERAVDLGSADAAFEMSLRSLTGMGMPRDDRAGVTWAHRAAGMGSGRACFNLGAFHATGRYGAAHDPREALSWYLRAADLDHGQGALMAGIMLLVGDGGLDVDVERAEELISTADYLLGGDAVADRLSSMGIPWPLPR